MITKAENNTASLTQLIFENRLEDLFAEYDSKTVAEFLRKAMSDDPEFGKVGNYSYFCKDCGGSWSFTDKIERAMFEKVHKATGCALKWKEATEYKTGGWVRGKLNIPPYKHKAINTIISVIEKVAAFETEPVPEATKLTADPVLATI